MNIFRLAGDLSHVISILSASRHAARHSRAARAVPRAPYRARGAASAYMIAPLSARLSSVLILRLRVSRSAIGVSVKTQELFLLVFVTRYLDLFTTFYSLYNSLMKVAYIAATSYIVFMIKYMEPYRSKYDTTQDSFLHWKFAVGPCGVLALITMGVSRNPDLVDLLWSFSIYLESLAIVPQLFVLQRYREVENLTGHYIFFLGAYRFLYILNWIYRSYYEPFYHHNWASPRVPPRSRARDARPPLTRASRPFLPRSCTSRASCKPRCTSISRTTTRSRRRAPGGGARARASPSCAPLTRASRAQYYGGKLTLPS